ncbi:MAG: hypothetical protein ACNA8W_16620 [Bradymonadaceae bacterium]
MTTLLFVFITCAFTIFTIYKMIAPFLEGRDDQIRMELLDEELREIEQLIDRKSALLQALRDIEYDWETAKISEDDYTRFKTSCERQAVGVMRRLDAIHGGRGWEAIIDEELQRRLSDRPGPSDEAESASQEPAVDLLTVGAMADSGADETTRTCTTCEAPLEPGDLFCHKCGSPVAQDPPPPEHSAANEEADEAVDLSTPDSPSLPSEATR